MTTLKSTKTRHRSITSWYRIFLFDAEDSERTIPRSEPVKSQEEPAPQNKPSAHNSGQILPLHVPPWRVPLPYSVMPTADSEILVPIPGPRQRFHKLRRLFTSPCIKRAPATEIPRFGSGLELHSSRLTMRTPHVSELRSVDPIVPIELTRKQTLLQRLFPPSPVSVPVRVPDPERTKRVLRCLLDPPIERINPGTMIPMFHGGLKSNYWTLKQQRRRYLVRVVFDSEEEECVIPLERDWRLKEFSGRVKHSYYGPKYAIRSGGYFKRRAQPGQHCGMRRTGLHDRQGNRSPTPRPFICRNGKKKRRAYPLIEKLGNSLKNTAQNNGDINQSEPPLTVGRQFGTVTTEYEFNSEGPAKEQRRMGRTEKKKRPAEREGRREKSLYVRDISSPEENEDRDTLPEENDQTQNRKTSEVLSRNEKLTADQWDDTQRSPHQRPPKTHSPSIQHSSSLNVDGRWQRAAMGRGRAAVPWNKEHSYYRRFYQPIFLDWLGEEERLGARGRVDRMIWHKTRGWIVKRNRTEEQRCINRRGIGGKRCLTRKDRDEKERKDEENRDNEIKRGVLKPRLTREQHTIEKKMKEEKAAKRRQKLMRLRIFYFKPKFSSKTHRSVHHYDRYEAARVRLVNVERYLRISKNPIGGRLDNDSCQFEESWRQRHITMKLAQRRRIALKKDQRLARRMHYGRITHPFPKHCKLVCIHFCSTGWLRVFSNAHTWE